MEKETWQAYDYKMDMGHTPSKFLSLRLILNRIWFKMFPKKQVAQEEMCNHFCHLPDKVETYLKTETGRQLSVESIFRFIDGQITIKENGN